MNSFNLKTVYEKVKVILLDIEGTTTSISFVKDVLFPFVKQGLTTFLADNWYEKECQACVKELMELSASDEKEGTLKEHVPIPADLSSLSQELQIEVIVKNVQWMMVINRYGPIFNILVN